MKITTTIFLGEEEIKLFVDYEIVDNGIGVYECHGYVGHDSRPEPEIINIESDHPRMQRILKSDNFFEFICEKLYDSEDFNNAVSEADYEEDPPEYNDLEYEHLEDFYLDQQYEDLYEIDF